MALLTYFIRLSTMAQRKDLFLKQKEESSKRCILVEHRHIVFAQLTSINNRFVNILTCVKKKKYYYLGQ